MTAPNAPSGPSTNGAYEAMAKALVVALVDEKIYCAIIATDGDKPRHNGGCPHACVGVKWEDGFLDLVCEKHGQGAEARGALVVWTRGAR